MKVCVNILYGHKVFAEQKIEDLEEKRIVPKMMLRRRLTRNAKIMLYLADKCNFSSGKVVYSSAFGELQATAAITDSILNEEQISPTFFQNSVYNTAPSYFSLLHENKDEVITVSSGNNSSRDALKTAALQALVSGERVLCIGTECLDIDKINEVNSCTSYLESGAAVVLEITKEKSDAVELVGIKEEGVIKSLQDLFALVKMYDLGNKKVYIEL